jgi:hypothetical protein
MSPEVCKNLLGFGTKLTDIGGYRRTGIRGYILTGSIYVCYYLGWEYGKLSDVWTGRFRPRFRRVANWKYLTVWDLLYIYFPGGFKDGPGIDSRTFRSGYERTTFCFVVRLDWTGAWQFLLFVLRRVRDDFFFSGNVGCILETAAETLPCLRRWLVNGYGIGRIRSRWLYYWIDGYGYRICSDSRRVYWDGCGGIFYFRICCATW